MAKGKKIVRLNIGEPDSNIPDFMKEELKKQIDADNSHYTDPQGVINLRTAIAEQITKTRGIKVTPDRIVVFPGGKPSIGFT